MQRNKVIVQCAMYMYVHFHTREHICIHRQRYDNRLHCICPLDCDNENSRPLKCRQAMWLATAHSNCRLRHIQTQLKHMTKPIEFFSFPFFSSFFCNELNGFTFHMRGIINLVCWHCTQFFSSYRWYNKSYFKYLVHKNVIYTAINNVACHYRFLRGRCVLFSFQERKSARGKQEIKKQLLVFCPCLCIELQTFFFF